MRHPFASFQDGDKACFLGSAEKDYREHDGKTVMVVRGISVPEEADAEVGPMYVVRTSGGGVEFHVFEDELTAPPYRILSKDENRR